MEIIMKNKRFILSLIILILFSSAVYLYSNDFGGSFGIVSPWKKSGTNISTAVSTDNVGVGESSPETDIEITSTVPYITLHNSTHEKTNGGMESRIRAKGEDPNGVEWHLGTIQFSHDGISADGKADIIFSNNDGNDADDTLQERMRIDSSGNVGIGITNPTYQLELGSSNPRIRFNDIEDVDAVISCNSDLLNFQDTAASAKLSINMSTGNVGIGTTLPDTLLHAEKSTALTSTQQEVIRISATTTGTPAAGFGAGMGFELETDANSAGHMEVVGGIYGVIEDPTLDSENGAVTIKTMTAGATATEKWRVKSDGTIQHQMTGSVYEWSYQAEVADDGTFTLPSFTNGANGWFIIGNNEERAYFTVDDDGDTTLLTDCSANIAADANTDTQFCIGVAATNEPKTIKNRLGATKNIFGKVYYY